MRFDSADRRREDFAAHPSASLNNPWDVNFECFHFQAIYPWCAFLVLKHVPLSSLRYHCFHLITVEKIDEWLLMWKYYDKKSFKSIFLLNLPLAIAIKCYACNSSDTSTPFQCGEWFDRYDKPDVEPTDCSSVHGAKYCIKHIGRFEGLPNNFSQLLVDSGFLLIIIN